MKWRWLFFIFLVPVWTAAEPESESLKLHKSILQCIDLQQYGQAIQLLQQMKQSDSQSYHSLPYAMLHARAFEESNQKAQALEIYETLVSDPKYSQFALLSAARISAGIQNSTKAAGFYRTYLRNPSYRDYFTAAQEALEYFLSEKKIDDLSATISQLQKGTTRRLTQFYLGKLYQLRKQTDMARSMFESLLLASKTDDITARALLELDLMQDRSVPESDLLQRGKLAYKVWNLDLAKKYLEPVASKNVDAAYYYGRTLFLMGDYPKARELFQQVMQNWPQDELAKLSQYQIGNVYLREGDFAKAAGVYLDVNRKDTGSLREESSEKAVYALRAQSKFSEALELLRNFATSKKASRRGAALFLRGRIYFQMNRYEDSLASFQQVLLLPSFKNNKEVLFWKGLALEKLKRKNDAQLIFRNLASSNDFYALKAMERLPSERGTVRTSSGFSLCRLPGIEEQDAVLKRIEAGDPLLAFLYLHMYEEAAHLLSGVSEDTWKILGVDPKSRAQKYLSVVYLAGLGGNFSTATYYGEMFLKMQPPSFSLFSLPDQILRVLFPWPYKDEILKSAKRSEVDPFVVLAIMRQESKFKRFARSQQFARGLMQLIPSTAARMAGAMGYRNFTEDSLYHPETNIDLGARYVRMIADEFGTQVERIAAGYNGGESNVRRWLASSDQNEPMDFVSTIDMNETKNYVMIVKSNYELYKRIYAKDLGVGQQSNTSSLRSANLKSKDQRED